MFTINLQSLQGFSLRQEEFAREVINKFETLMNSEQLKKRIISFTCSLGQRFEDNLGLTNHQIYEKLISGNEVYKPETNF